MLQRCLVLQAPVLAHGAAHTLLSAYPHAHLKTFQTIQPMDTFEIDMPPFTPKQDMNALVTKPRTAHGNIANAHAQS